jgi:hypothetical protein
VADISEPEERSIRDYVNSQSPEDDQAELVQKVPTDALAVLPSYPSSSHSAR